MLFWSVTATYLAPTQGQSQTDNVTWQEGFGFGRCWPILETSLPHHHLRPSSASDVGVSTEILLRNLSCRGSNESPIMNKWTQTHTHTHTHTAGREDCSIKGWNWEQENALLTPISSAQKGGWWNFPRSCWETCSTDHKYCAPTWNTCTKILTIWGHLKEAEVRGGMSRCLTHVEDSEFSRNYNFWLFHYLFSRYPQNCEFSPARHGTRVSTGGGSPDRARAVKTEWVTLKIGVVKHGEGGPANTVG